MKVLPFLIFKIGKKTFNSVFGINNEKRKTVVFHIQKNKGIYDLLN